MMRKQLQKEKYWHSVICVCCATLINKTAKRKKFNKVCTIGNKKKDEK